MLRQNIMHAGGQIDGLKYTNSLESVARSVANSEKLIELDCVKIRDSYVLAHDGTEAKFYGFAGRFEDVELAGYRNLKVHGRLTPLDYELLDGIGRENPTVTFVIDAKVERERYRAFVGWLVKSFPRLAGTLCLQVYSRDDAAIAADHGINKCIVALWKYFDHDPLGEDAAEFVATSMHCGMDILGISLRYQNPKTKAINIDDARLERLKGFGHKIFLHGHDGFLRLEQQVRLNLDYGFFSHISWAALPPDFDWQEYIAMYRDLAHFDELKAKCHWLEFGQMEARKCRIQCPDDFDWRIYKDLNRDLNLPSEREARAHYSIRGRNEGRRYNLLHDGNSGAQQGAKGNM